MRFDLRLHGRTDLGLRCLADVSVYARSKRQLREQAMRAAETAAWLARDPPYDSVPEGSKITVEHVEQIHRRDSRRS
jgi:hypothetical protein